MHHEIVRKFNKPIRLRKNILKTIVRLQGQLIYDDMSNNVVYLFSILDEMTHNVIYSLLFIRRKMKYKATRVY